MCYFEKKRLAMGWRQGGGSEEKGFRGLGQIKDPGEHTGDN